MIIAKKKMHIFQIMYARSSYAIMRAQILSLCKIYARLCTMHYQAAKNGGIIFCVEYSCPCSNYSEVGILFHA
jgi:hypothetical protein